MDIKVSVIMAVYNSEKYLRQAVDSLLFQSLCDIEIILVDDGSTDRSLEILKEYETKDSRVRVLQNTLQSDGAAVARNLGVAAARGKYVSVVDADDFFEADMLMTAYECAEQYGADVTIFDGFRYDDLNGIDLERDTILCSTFLPGASVGRSGSADDRFCFTPDENRNDLFRMTLGAAWNVLFSLDLIRRNDLKFAPFHHADDLEFVYMAFALADRIAILPRRLVHYRVNHAGTQASMVSLWPDTAWQAMLSFKDHLVRAGVFEKYRIAFIRVAAKYQLFYLNAMRDMNSFRRLYNALREGKLNDLGIAAASPEDLGDRGFVKQRDIIMREDADGYLFAKINRLPPFDEAIGWKGRIPRGSRLVVYGADRLGVDIVHSILWNQDYKLISWVDDQYESLGYPVRSPEELRCESLHRSLVESMDDSCESRSDMDRNAILDTEYDFILIISRSKDIFEKRRASLMNMGVDETKIRWQNE